MSDEKKFVVAQLSSIQGQYFNYDKEEDAVEKASILANSSEKPTIGIYRLMKLAKPETPPVIIVDVK